jgi:heptosyltransferase-1
MTATEAPPRRILIIRLSAIGDVIMASALIPALKEAYPGVHLAWLTEESSAGLLRNNPRLDQVIVWPRRRWRQLARERRYLSLWREFRDLARTLRQPRFDWVLDIHGLLKSGVWAFLSGAPTRIGLGSREGSQWLMTQTLARDSGNADDLRISSEYLKLARALGLQPARFDMDIVASASEQAEARALLQAHGVVGPFAVACPFTTRPQKHWFGERWAELATRLRGQTGLAVVMLGGPGDTASAAAIAAQAPGVANLVGQTSLGVCAALIGQAKLLVGVDTGLTHLGIAMRTPTVALFGSTCPYLDPGYAQARVLYEPLECSPCHRRPRCGGEFTCMKQHTADKVLACAAALLDETP